MGNRWRSLLQAALAILVPAAVTLLLREQLAPVNLAMIYLLGVVYAASRSSQWTSAVVALCSVAAFDFICVPPYFTLQVADREYLVTFFGMLVVAMVISTQTQHVLAQSRESRAREARAQTLYQLSNRLAQETEVFEIARVAADLAAGALSANVVIFMPENGAISFRSRTSEHLQIPKAEETIANWTLQHGRKAGLGVDPLLNATALYVPLRGARATVGVMAVIPKQGAGPDEREREILIDLFASNTALAMERTISNQAVESARLQVQTEQMRSSLLSAVSHDLLTPLASITGAASTVRRQGAKLSDEVRDELLESISEETERLSRLVRNLLDMTRFETGGVELRRDAVPLEEIVGAALQRLDSALKGRDVRVEIDPELPLVVGDEILLGQVFINLLENAAKYTPEDSQIEISARETRGRVRVDVRDHGPGIAEGHESRLFDKFFRSQATNSRGAGLGLAIAKAVMESHGGSIECFNHRDGGAVFRLYLPMQLAPVEEPA